MTLDPLAPYAIDQPLTEEEQQFLEFLRTSEGGEEHLNSIKEAGVEIQELESVLYLVPGSGEHKVIEQLLDQTLNPFTVKLHGQGHSGLAFGASAFSIRVGTYSLGSNHPSTLTSYNNLAFCLDKLGRAAEALPLFEQTL
ncbi:tetratricopeptide repeat protein, partial [Gammaproteobacteria bacterium]|nr:tetratricopeptide repeat protein [Gammaproteobacteria bacterium]